MTDEKENAKPGEATLTVGESVITGTLAAMAAGSSSPTIHVTPSTVGGPIMAGGGLVGGGPVVPPIRKPLEHVVLPQRLPKRVLVAFLDEDGKHEPFWAAYLDPQDIEVVMSPMNPEEAHMDLRLSLVKRFEQ